ncbi:MAG: hypothetical protein JWP89_5050 [Schlesneria sp.]|nr:hypothetical protein [Schlesneria sp.]
MALSKLHNRRTRESGSQHVSQNQREDSLLVAKRRHSNQRQMRTLGENA